jgi:tRNA threonylcarbamoyladenosine biosynthesis protein TsaB
MLVLAVDTAHAACSACVYDTATGEVLASASEPMRQGHAERLPGLIEETLQAAGVSLAGIGRLAACSGPGTFTGVRIGLAFVRGLALVLKVPVIGVTTFEALSASVRGIDPQGDSWVIQDARRGEVYLQGFDAGGTAIGEPRVLDYNAAAVHLAGASGVAIGSGTTLVQLPAALAATSLAAIPDIAQVARLAAVADPGAYSAVCILPARARCQGTGAAGQPCGRGDHHRAGRRTPRRNSLRNPCNEFRARLERRPVQRTCQRAGKHLPACAHTRQANDGGQPQPCGFVLARKAADEMEISPLPYCPPCDAAASPGACWTSCAGLPARRA